MSNLLLCRNTLYSPCTLLSLQTCIWILTPLLSMLARQENEIYSFDYPCNTDFDKVELCLPISSFNKSFLTFPLQFWYTRFFRFDRLSFYLAQSSHRSSRLFLLLFSQDFISLSNKLIRPPNNMTCKNGVIQKILSVSNCLGASVSTCLTFSTLSLTFYLK